MNIAIKGTSWRIFKPASINTIDRMRRKKGRDHADLDSVMEALEAQEAKENRYRKRDSAELTSHAERQEIGEVERYFEKIGVAAIKLTGSISVGDTLEIDDNDETIRLRVSSMQIDRKDVADASAGDDVGIKLNHSVESGSKVYRL